MFIVVNLKGPETVLLVEYAKKHNITLLFDTSFDYLGVFRSNWTGTGYMDTLLQDKIDLIACKFNLFLFIFKCSIFI